MAEEKRNTRERDSMRGEHALGSIQLILETSDLPP